MQFWWKKQASWQSILLSPLSFCYRALLRCRRFAYQQGWFKRYQAPVPVIIVGNYTVGGTGKTPLVIALAKHLQQRGLSVGIVSRGYGAKAPHYPFEVRADAQVEQTGDEPLLIARASNRPVFIDPNRPRAVKALLAQYACDVVIADDGLQHLALQPSLAIAAIDGERRFGNQQVLPAGPLREPLPSNLTQVMWVVNGVSERPHEWAMQLQGSSCYRLSDGAQASLTDFQGQSIIAIAGIGNPERFFESLRQAGLNVETHAFADHHAYSQADFAGFDLKRPLLMTEKDAVKCQGLALDNAWVVPVEAVLPEAFWTLITERYHTCQSNII